MSATSGMSLLLPGMILWLEANPAWCFKDAGMTAPCGDGDLIYSWMDRSPAANHMIQADPIMRPILVKAGSSWVATFDGSDAGMAGASGPTLTGATTIGSRAYETNAPVTSRMIQSLDVNAVLSLRRTDGNGFFVGSAVSAGPFAADGNGHTAVASKASGGNWSLRVDGVAQSVNAVSTNFGRLVLGFPGWFTESFLGGIAGVVVTNTQVTGGNLAILESYLNGLYP